MYLNIDIDSTIKPFLDDLADKGHAVKEDLYPFIDEFIDTKVTDIVLNIGSQFSAVRSKYWDSYYEKYHQTVENGYHCARVNLTILPCFMFSGMVIF